jgi:hypothetical protein
MSKIQRRLAARGLVPIDLTIAGAGITPNRADRRRLIALNRKRANIKFSPHDIDQRYAFIDANRRNI